jgi:Fic family protein
MGFDPNKPYNELPLLPPEKRFIESVSIFKKLTSARSALAELKGRAPIIPNPDMLINTLVLQEAKDSSSIENVFTTNDEMYKAFSTSQTKISLATKEVLKYREALSRAFDKLSVDKNFTVDLFVNIYQDIKDAQDGIRDVNVRIGNETVTKYRPPEHGSVLNNKISNWLDFANSNNEIDPVLKMAILHYQFESIHPFRDGNGRTGRIINVLYLALNGLLDLPILYLSNYILANKTRYYELFNEVTENKNWEAWILYLLDAVENTSILTLNKINDIYALFNETLEIVKSKALDIYSYELVEILFHQPYCKISFLVNANIATRNTASKYLNKLVELRILKKEKSGKESLFLNKKLYNLLTSS